MFAEVEQYLNALPNGVDSFTDCRCRSDIYEFIYNEALPILSRHNWKPHVPKALHDPGSGQWRPEVNLGLLHCVLRDCLGSDEAFLDFAYQTNAKLYHTPLMRVIVAVISPTLLVSGASKRWAKIRQGSSLTNGRFEERDGRVHVVVTLRTPEGLYPMPMKRALAKAYQAAADAAKAKSPSVEVVSKDAGVTQFNVSWDK